MKSFQKDIISFQKVILLGLSKLLTAKRIEFKTGIYFAGSIN